MNIIDAKLPKVKSEKAMISFNEELSDGAKSSERLNQFLAKIENLRNLSPDEYTQQIMKLVDNRLEQLDYATSKKRENLINTFISDMKYYKDIKRNYKKELIHKYNFNDPIKFNYNDSRCPLRSFSN